MSREGREVPDTDPDPCVCVTLHSIHGSGSPVHHFAGSHTPTLLVATVGRGVGPSTARLRDCWHLCLLAQGGICDS